MTHVVPISTINTFRPHTKALHAQCKARYKKRYFVDHLRVDPLWEGRVLEMWFEHDPIVVAQSSVDWL